MEPYFAVTIGSILGDGCLGEPSVRKDESQLYVSQHSDKKQYLIWLRNELRAGFGVCPIKPKKGYDQYYFLTKPDGRLGNLRRKFYPNGLKIIPHDIRDLLVDPISLAVWYMDDGTLDFRLGYHSNAMFATYGFSFEGCNRLRNALDENFDLDVSVTKCTMRGKVYPRLYVKAGSMERFAQLISPHIHGVFKYKRPVI